jgi:hypothetical protein
MQAHEWLCSHGHEERLSMFPLYPHEIAYDAERVRIAAAVGDEELAEHGISIAERRASPNPDVPSCAAAAAHARGIWSDSAQDLERAKRPRPARLAALRGLRSTHDAAREQA